MNAPKCPFHSNHRDGQMRVDSNNGAEVGYEPNSKDALQENLIFPNRRCRSKAQSTAGTTAWTKTIFPSPAACFA